MSAIPTKVKKDNYTGGVAITPNDTTDLVDPVSALYIGGAGTGALKVDTIGGDTITLAGVAVGILEIAVKRVYATGTGVTNIVGLK